MILDKIFTQNNAIETAMQASAVRNDVILNNIANSDVPGYKKKTVLFEDALGKALNEFERTGVVDLSKAKPTVKELHSGYSYRMDGNNVDMDVEMVDLYKNAVRYDVFVSSVMNNYKSINLVFSAR